MTRTISTVLVTGIAALVLSGSALAQSEPLKRGLGDFRQEPATTVRVSPDLADRALAAEQGRVSSMLDAREKALGVSIEGQVNAVDARERSLGAKYEAQLAATGHSDWFERSAAATIGDRVSPVVDDRFRITPTSAPNPVTVSSGREIEWPQVGIGFGVGLLLVLGLVLTLRATHTRPFAH